MSKAMKILLVISLCMNLVLLGYVVIGGNNAGTEFVSLSKDSISSNYTETLDYEFFEPQQGRFEYLSPKKQDVMRELISRRKNLVKDQMFFAPDDISTSAGFHWSGDYLSIETSIRKLLTREEYDEYLLRESAISQQIRLMGADLTRDQFKCLHEMMLQTANSPGAYLFHKRAFFEKYCNSAFEYSQFINVSMKLDHTYQMISALSSHYDVVQSDIEMAYHEVSKFYEQVVPEVLGVEQSLPLARGELDFSTLELKLMDILGDEAAGTVMFNLKGIYGDEV